MSMADLFGYYLQGGRVDVGFLGAAQIDRFGNINTTVIGDYGAPADAAARLRRRLRDRAQCPPGLRRHAPVVPLVRRTASTSAPRREASPAGGSRASSALTGPRRPDALPGPAAGLRSSSPTSASTTSTSDGEMRLDSLHPGASLDDVRAAMAWQVRVSPDLATTAAPSARGAPPHPRGPRPARATTPAEPPCTGSRARAASHARAPLRVAPEPPQLRTGSRSRKMRYAPAAIMASGMSTARSASKGSAVGHVGQADEPEDEADHEGPLAAGALIPAEAPGDEEADADEERAPAVADEVAEVRADARQSPAEQDERRHGAPW